MKEELNIEISKNDCSNIPELITLSETYYTSGDIINKDYLDWQYNINPAGKPFLFTSRDLSNNILAGQYLVIPLYYSILNNKIKGTLSLNTLTHPSYQGKGLFTRMALQTYADCSKNEAAFTIGFPNPLSYPGFVKKLDFQHLGDVPLFVKPLRPLNIASSFVKKNKEKHGGEIVIGEQKHSSIFEINSSENVDELDNFWSSMQSQYGNCTIKDASFLTWRYSTIPTRNYKVYAFKKDNKIEGIIVLKAANTWGFKVGLIMDFLVLNNDSEVGKELLSFTRSLSKQAKLDFIACLHSDNYESEILRKNGYYKVPRKILPQKIHFIVRQNIPFENSESIQDMSKWKLTFGDYDVF